MAMSVAACANVSEGVEPCSHAVAMSNVGSLGQSMPAPCHVVTCAVLCVIFQPLARRLLLHKHRQNTPCTACTSCRALSWSPSRKQTSQLAEGLWKRCPENAEVQACQDLFLVVVLASSSSHHPQTVQVCVFCQVLHHVQSH